MAVKPDEREREEAEATDEEPVGRDEGGDAPVSHRIRDLASFDRVTGGTREVAGLYFYHLLGNPLIEVAEEVSRDFFRRPQIFTEPGNPPVAKLLARLSSRMGSDETIPSRMERDAIFSALFGDPANGDADFPRLRDELVHAAAAFAERAFDDGVGMLRERVREAHRPFKEYLTGLQGASTTWSRTVALPTVTEVLSFSILRSLAVSSAYGIPRAPGESWPYTEDANGDKLVEEITKRRSWTNGPTGSLSREAFSSLQRAALRGAEALATIIDFSEGGSDDELDVLITKVYSWGAALLPEQRLNRNSQPLGASPSPVMEGAPVPS